MTPATPTLRIFLSHAPEDQTLAVLLRRHLAPLMGNGVFYCWSRADLRGGEAIEPRVESELAGADVIVPLLSADYLSSHERRDVLRASELGRLVIPILLRPCAYGHDRLFGGCTVLPRDVAGRAFPIVRSHQTQHDDGLAAVTEQLRESVRQLHQTLRQEITARQATAAGVAYPPSSGTYAPSSGAYPPSSGTYPPSSGAYPASAPRSSGMYVIVPPLPSRPAKTRRSALTWVLASMGLCASIAVVVLLVMASHAVSATEPARPLPTASAPEPPRSTATAPPAQEQPRCCGGVDCKPPAKDVRNTYCEKSPGQCTECLYSGRSYIGGSCSAPLAAEREFLLRVAYGNHRDPKADEVCVRLSGTIPFTCSAADPKSVASAMLTRLPVRVADISGAGRGLDIELRNSGVTIASHSAATIDALSAAMLCVGVSFRVGTGMAVFYLDDP